MNQCAFSENTLHGCVRAYAYDDRGNLFYDHAHLNSTCQKRHKQVSIKVGRYISSDPIGIDGGLNLYSYVGQSPIMYVDLMGQQEQGLTARILGGPANPVCAASAVATCVKWGVVITTSVLGGACVSGEIQCSSASDDESDKPKTLSIPGVTEDHSVEICKEACDAGHAAEVQLCQQMNSKKNRAVCYSEAAERYGQCLKDCGK